MQICRLPILILATLSILMAGCAEVSLLTDAAMMKSPGSPGVSKEEGKGSEAQREADKLADVRKLLEITRAQAIFEQVGAGAFHQTIANIREKQPDFPDKDLVVVEDEVRRVVHEGMMTDGGLLDILCQIYSKYFTHEEIKDVLAFYQTEVGKKAIRVSPPLMQEQGQATAQWGAALDPVIQQRVMERLKKEGIELKE